VALSRRTGRSRFTLLLLVLSSVTVLTLDFRGAGFLEEARDAALGAFGPVRSAADTAVQPLRNAWNGVFNYDDVERENERLRDQLARQAGDQVRNEDAAGELDRLLGELDIDYVGDIRTATARVVAGPASNFEHTIEIDKGSGKGIEVGMPVVTGAGLVGRVAQVAGGRSVVQLLTDPEFTVGVRLLGSGDIGVAHGAGPDRPLEVDAGIDPKTPVATGEAVMSSGTDRGRVPPGVPIGTVESAREDAGGLQKAVRVTPIADLDALSYVQVMLWEPAP
jgi:rod shape-determining protein MreC